MLNRTSTAEATRISLREALSPDTQNEFGSGLRKEDDVGRQT
jgi:hypothetical protein